jgi:hypothetical protein
MLGHGSTFERPNGSPAQVKAQKSQSLKTSKALSLRDHISDPRRKDHQGLEFETYRIETFGFETNKFKALISETMEFRD